MRYFRIEVDIDAPPDRVWAIMSDFAKWPEWTPTVSSIEQLDPSPITLGTRLLIRQPKLPPAIWKLTELEEGQYFSWVNKGPGVHVIARHGVEVIDGKSRAKLSLEFSGLIGGLVGLFTKGINKRYLALEAAGLKTRSENT